MRQQLAAGPVPGGPHLGLGGAQVVAAVVLRGPGIERVDPALEGVILADIVVVPDPGRIDGAVQDHAADPAREKRGVHLADIRAVGEREIVDFRHPERGPDGIQVASHILGGHVRKQPAELLLAVRRVRPGPVDQHLLGGRGGRDVVRARAGEETGFAAQLRHRGADAARVEAHDVVVPRRGRAEPPGHLGGQRQAAGPGTARVDEQDPLLLGDRGGSGDHVERGDVQAARIRVVDRHAQHGAVGDAQLGGRPRAGVPVQGAADRDDRPGVRRAARRGRPAGGRIRRRGRGRAMRRAGRGREQGGQAQREYPRPAAAHAPAPGSHGHAPHHALATRARRPADTPGPGALAFHVGARRRAGRRSRRILPLPTSVPGTQHGRQTSHRVRMTFPEDRRTGPGAISRFEEEKGKDASQTPPVAHPGSRQERRQRTGQ